MNLDQINKGITIFLIVLLFLEVIILIVKSDNKEIIPYKTIGTKSNYSTTSTTYTSFTNKYGTITTICAHSGCTNHIASSGDTNCCTLHSRKCLECGCYIDEDAMYCMSCIKNTIR